MSKWNIQQLEFIRQASVTGTLFGVPGAGKTRTIIGRVMHLIDNGLLRKDGFAVVTFSRAACNDFRRKGDALRVGLFNTRNVRTIHSLAGTICSRMWSGKTSSLQTVVVRATDALANSEFSHFEKCVPELANLKVLFVDEAQDVSETQYAFANQLATIVSGHVVMIGDPNQSIYTFQKGDNRYLRMHPGNKIQLVNNYRSTQQIVDIVEAARPFPGDVPMKSMMGAGERPVLARYPRTENGVSRLKQHILATIRKSSLQSFAVIGPVKTSYKNNRFMRIGLQWIANFLHDEDIPFEIHYDESAESSRGSRGMKGALQAGKVHLLTIHASKGLEFDDVIVVNFHQNAMGLPADLIKQSTIDDWRCLWYVALSRARFRMTCFAISDEPVFSFGKTDDEAIALLNNLFDCKGVVTFPRKKRRTERDSFMHRTAWTDLLNDRVRLDERSLCVIEDNMLDRVTRVLSTDCYSGNDKTPPEWDALSSLYGEWAEAYFEHSYRGGRPHVYYSLQDMVTNIVAIPERLRAVTQRYLRAVARDAPLVSVDRLREHVAMSRSEEMASLLEIVQQQRPNAEIVHLYVANDSRWFDVGRISDMMATWETGDLSIADIWTMCFIMWQYKAEAKYRYIANDPDPQFVAQRLRPFANCIQSLASSWEDGWTFQCTSRWNGLPVDGIADAVHFGEKHVAEFKFSPSGFQTIHAIQAIGYAVMHGADPSWKVSVIDLYNGSVHECVAKFQPECRNAIHSELARALDIPARNYF